jgi:hypothetical protein
VAGETKQGVRRGTISVPPPGSVAPDPASPPPPGPVTSLEDPRALQILSTEHWSLLSTRSLVYNEAFTRAGMFLTFVSMSFVALALVASTISAATEVLVVAAAVLAFDVIIGLTTYGRIIAANQEDFRALHGMARIRHAYGEAAPLLAPYFTTSMHDDPRGVMSIYGEFRRSFVSDLVYGLTTSGGMVGLIVSLLAGALGLVVAVIAGLPMALGLAVAVGAGLLVFTGLIAMTMRYFGRQLSRLPSLFPSPEPEVLPVSSTAPSAAAGDETPNTAEDPDLE